MGFSIKPWKGHFLPALPFYGVKVTKTSISSSWVSGFNIPQEVRNKIRLAYKH